MVARPLCIKITMAVLCLLAGCFPSNSSESQGPSSDSSCGAATVHQVVRRFTDSFDRGDIGQLDQLFSGSRFQWYSTDAPGQRIDPQARDRGSLMAYFAKRHQHHEQLKLESFAFNGISSGFGHFQFELSRSADDGLAPTPYAGKGAVDCSSPQPTLAVWSMARRRR